MTHYPTTQPNKTAKDPHLNHEKNLDSQLTAIPNPDPDTTSLLNPQEAS